MFLHRPLLPCPQVILPEIRKTFELPPGASSEAREKQAEVQGQLCGVLLVVVKKLSEEEDTKPAVLPYADQVGGPASGGRRGRGPVQVQMRPG